MRYPRLHRTHTVNRVARDVVDGIFQSGEPVCVLHVYSPQNPGPRRCPKCYDDVYRSSDTSEGGCRYCFFTTYDRGVDKAYITYAAVTDQQNVDRSRGKRGENVRDERRVTLPGHVRIQPGDWVFRVKTWDNGFPDETESANRVGRVEQRFIRDGIKSSVDSDIVAYQATLEETSSDHQFSEFSLRDFETLESEGRLVDDIGTRKAFINSQSIRQDTNTRWFA